MVMKRLTSVVIAALMLATGGWGAVFNDRDKLALNVDDLGFSPEQTKSDSAMQYRLEKRTEMLRIHQRLGLLTAVALAATLLTADGVDESSSKRNRHADFGLASAGLYFTTVSFAIFAPEVPGVRHSGATRIHRALAFVHFPAMCLVPILGLKAKHQLDRGEPVHGSARYHTTAVGAAVASFYLSLAVVTFNF